MLELGSQITFSSLLNDGGAFAVLQLHSCSHGFMSLLGDPGY